MVTDNICKFSNISSSDLICTHFVYENTSVHSDITHTDRYMLGFAASGEAVLCKNGEEFIISKGNAFFINKDTEFSIRSQSGISYFYISFHGRRADELVHRLDLTGRSCIFDISESCDEFSAFAFNCLSRANDENTDIIGECALLYLLSYLTIKKTSSTSLLSKMIALTEKNFTDSAFSLGMLSELMNYDAKYLSFYFKKHKQLCYSEYLRDLRIRHSVFLIEQGITSVKNIALLSGFSDALYFSKIFKKAMKKTPKEYIAFWSESKQ